MMKLILYKARNVDHTINIIKIVVKKFQVKITFCIMDIKYPFIRIQ